MPGQEEKKKLRLTKVGVTYIGSSPENDVNL